MINDQSTIDKEEVKKFSQHANEWWDLNGPLKTLHDINATRLDFINQYLNFKDATVLDVGCGGGVLAEGMAKKGALVLGIDASEQAIEIARAHASENALTIHYESIPIEDYEHTGFDAITCMEMLEHVPHPELVIRHCKRLLKPGGLLFLSTISRTIKAYASAIIAAEYILGLLPKQTHDYGKFIKPSELVSFSRREGFELLDLKGLSYNPLSRSASLCADVSINYLLVLQS